MGLNFGRKIETLKTATAPLACIDESIRESVEGLAEASVALFEAQGDGHEICQVLDNLTLVAGSIAKSGVTKQTLEAFNSENELGQVAGVEGLTVEGLEKMAKEEVEGLQKKINAGLEAQFAEYWAKFIEWLKNLWTKMVNWLKSQFTNQARYVNYLEAAKGGLKEVNGDAQAAVHKAGDVKAILGRCKNCIGQLKAAADKFKASGALAKGTEDIGKRWFKQDDQDAISAFNNGAAETAALKGLGYGSAGDITGAIDVYISVAKSRDFADAAKAFTDGLGAFVKEAENAAKLEGEAAANAKAAVQARRAVVNDMLAMVRMLAKTVQKCGGELQKVVKAAGTKAAAAK